MICFLTCPEEFLFSGATQSGLFYGFRVFDFFQEVVKLLIVGIKVFFTL